ncbi:RHS repeat-associated core domain-containing protein [Pseudomonas moorei]|uniref:RHS repeat-associated core domain-containing protein n=1 Tax=Pseudomonas moorei TaxID=395599 RepID=UPI001FF209ED|nr:RHS repeat-associated core domain-containing protein [Pseudomonas moorei]
MSQSKQSWLIRYHYDPLNQMTSHTVSDTPASLRFYRKNRLTTEIQGAVGYSIVQHDDLLLAQQQHQQNAHDSTLLATDLQRSPLHTLKKNAQPQPIAYSPYGHRSVVSALLSLSGFNGERQDPVTGHYTLGNYRAFNPVLMRFNSPDSLSPFGRGGINAYTYCLNDPVNRVDPNGHFSASSLIKPFSFLKKQIARPYYKLASQSRSATSTPLTNRFDRKYTNLIEDLIAAEKINKGDLKLTVIKSKEDLNIIKLKELDHKYILTQDNTLVVGSFTPDPSKSSKYEPKHSSIARIYEKFTSSEGAGVVSAGVITRTNHGYQVTNYSGHYLTPPKTNTLVKFKIRSLGASAKSKAYDIRHFLT